MPDSPDDLLLTNLAAGQPDAFAALYDIYAPRLYPFALTMLRNTADAEDAIQELFTSLLRSRHNLPNVNNLTSYLFTSLRHITAKQVSRRRIEQNTMKILAANHESNTPIPSNLNTEQTDKLNHHLLKLPHDQREVIALKIDADLTFAQIAHVLNISINTAASRYRYALNKLRTALSENKS